MFGGYNKDLVNWSEESFSEVQLQTEKQREIIRFLEIVTDNPVAESQFIHSWNKHKRKKVHTLANIETVYPNCDSFYEGNKLKRGGATLVPSLYAYDNWDIILFPINDTQIE